MRESRGVFARLEGPTGSPITLIEGDSVPRLPRELSRGSVDVVVTSPPYNLGVGYSTYDDRRPKSVYLRWIGRFGRSVDTVLSDSGSFFLNVGGPPSDPGWPWEVAKAAGVPFVLQNVIHWVKSITIDRASAGRSSGVVRDLAVGHYKPVNSKRYLNSAHEYIFHFTRFGTVELDRLAIGVPYQDRSNATRWRSGGPGLRCRGNAWFLPYPTIQRRSVDRPHPASFPSELPERCLRLHGAGPRHLAVDPFLGIGASAIAAARVGVPFVGFDLDREYLRAAVRALEALGARPTRVAPATPSAAPGPRTAARLSRPASMASLKSVHGPASPSGPSSPR